MLCRVSLSERQNIRTAQGIVSFKRKTKQQAQEKKQTNDKFLLQQKKQTLLVHPKRVCS